MHDQKINFDKIQAIINTIISGSLPAERETAVDLYKYFFATPLILLSLRKRKQPDTDHWLRRNSF